MKLALVGSHIALIVGGVLADQRIGSGGCRKLGQVLGGRDIARVEAGAVGIVGVPHTQHASLGIHRLDEGAQTARVVASQR